ncbi:MAG TPA: DUF4407 domain-containing protein [Pseudonocardia sp.]|nr:DUF4407 domain-containing protein [Pseudonocardia sp.]
MSSPVRRTPLTGPANLMVWLGGGNAADIDDAAERSTYQTTGALVALNAVVAGAVVAFVAGLAGAHAPGGWLFGLAAGLLVGAVGRTLATASPDPELGRTPRLLGDLGRGLVAVLIGVLVGELAALALFAGAINRELDGQLDAASTAVAGGQQGRELGALQASRVALDAQVDAATARRDRSLVVARCEYRPGPGCPSNQITGDPGRGPEAAQANADLTAAEHDVTEATTRRDQLAPGLDADIAAARTELTRDTARAQAVAAADTGVDARWAAMNRYTTQTADSAGPLVLRIAFVVLFVLLNLLPLVLRRWRGQTDQDRRALARRLRNRAEEEAATSVAVSRAKLHAALELDRHRALLASTLPADGLDAVQLSPGRPPAPVGELVGPPPADRDQGPATPDRLPVPTRRRDLASRSGDPLDLLPGPLPGAVRALGGLVRPLVPSPVARLAASAPRSSFKVALGLWEEVEELQFTVLRKRTVRLASDEFDQSSGAPASEAASAPAPEPTVTRAQADILAPRPAARAAAELTDPLIDTETDPEVTGRTRRELSRGRRALAGRGRRALPPADED